MSFQYFPFQEGAREQPAWSNRRASVRYHCGPATPGRVYLAEKQEFLRAWVLDLSKHGISVVIPRALDVGQLVTITMKNTSGDRTFELPALVAHVNRHPQGEWVVGFGFASALEEDDLDALLG